MKDLNLFIIIQYAMHAWMQICSVTLYSSAFNVCC